MPNPGYPVGWVRIQQDLDSYEDGEILWMLSGFHNGQWSAEHITFGSAAWWNAVVEMGKLPFTEQDKAWYHPHGGSGF